jgi:hypothetical protein
MGGYPAQSGHAAHRVRRGGVGGGEERVDFRCRTDLIDTVVIALYERSRTEKEPIFPAIDATIREAPLSQLEHRVSVRTNHEFMVTLAGRQYFADCGPEKGAPKGAPLREPGASAGQVMRLEHCTVAARAR